MRCVAEFFPTNGGISLTGGWLCALRHGQGSSCPSLPLNASYQELRNASVILNAFLATETSSFRCCISRLALAFRSSKSLPTCGTHNAHNGH